MNSLLLKNFLPPFPTLRRSMYHSPCSLSQEIIEHILHHLDITDLFAFGACCRKFRESRDSYLYHRLLRSFALRNLSLPSFLTALHQTGAIIGGSLVLSLLFPESSLTWEPTSLDIFVSCQHSPAFHAFLLDSGSNEHQIIHAPIPSSMRSHISNLRIYSFEYCTIKLFTTLSAYAVSSLVHAPLTCLMNFITASSIYVMYPQLTLRSLCLINPFLAYRCSFKRDVLLFLSKHNDHGFTACQCSSLHHFHSPCKTSIRHALDSWTLRFTLPNFLSTAPLIATPPFPAGERHIIWKLGGCGCSKQNRLVWPYVRTRYNPVSIVALSLPSPLLTP